MSTAGHIAALIVDMAIGANDPHLPPDVGHVGHIEHVGHVGVWGFDPPRTNKNMLEDNIPFGQKVCATLRLLGGQLGTPPKENKKMVSFSFS